MCDTGQRVTSHVVPIFLKHVSPCQLTLLTQYLVSGEMALKINTVCT